MYIYIYKHGNLFLSIFIDIDVPWIDSHFKAAYIDNSTSLCKSHVRNTCKNDDSRIPGERHPRALDPIILFPLLLLYLYYINYTIEFREAAILFKDK